MMRIRLAAKTAKSGGGLEALGGDVTHNPIGNAPAGKALDKGAWIEHRILTMVFRATAIGDVVATPMYRIDDPVSPALGTKVDEYVKTVAAMQAAAPFPKGGRYDVDLPNMNGGGKNHQRWLVLQLDPRIQWSFTPGELAVSAREDHPGEDYDLYFMDDKQNITGPGGVAPPNCKLVFWAIMDRPDDGTGNCVRKFNYHVQIEDIDDTANGPMVTVFDPSIPNTGGGTIP